jgi:L-asparagine transporter-like permease
LSALEFFTGFITVFEDPVWDWIAGGILVTVSGSIAYAIGGQLGYSGKIGWVLWLITAVAVYAAIACVIRAIMWLIALPWWVWVIVGSVIAAGIVLAVVLKYRSKSGETR